MTKFCHCRPFAMQTICFAYCQLRAFFAILCTSSPSKICYHRARCYDHQSRNGILQHTAEIRGISPCEGCAVTNKREYAEQTKENGWQAHEQNSICGVNPPFFVFLGKFIFFFSHIHSQAFILNNFVEKQGLSLRFFRFLYLLYNFR